MKRIVSLILICCLAMALSVGAFAVTEESYPGGLSLDNTSVEVGEEVVLTVSLPDDALATLQFGIVFPEEYLQITEINAPGVGEKGVGLYAAADDVDTANENGYVTFAFVGTKGDNLLQAADGFLTITFEAVAESSAAPISFAGDAVLPLIMDALNDSDGSIRKTFKPGASSVTLEITAPEYILGDVDADGVDKLFTRIEKDKC